MATLTSFADLVELNKRQTDSPDTKHISYLAHEKQIQVVNDIYSGVDGASDYLFQFPQELKETYDIRKDRATLRNFVKRAVEAFTGMIFRKPIEVLGYGARTTRCFQKIDAHNNMLTFTKLQTIAAIKDGKTYILIDSPRDGSGQPYFVAVDRSQLINWRKDSSGNFTMIVIEETISIPVGSFGTKFIKQWRHYNEKGDIAIYRKNGNGEIVKFDDIVTEYNGIPFVEIDIDDVPILYDTAKLNIKHFNRMSHKDRYLTMASLPIPVIWGADIGDDGEPSTAKPAMVIGVDEAFMFSSKEDGDFQWRELKGDSIDLIEKDLDSITEDITTGILRAVDNANAVQKTATEVALLQAEASDRVSAIAIAVEIGIKAALEILSEFNTESVPKGAVFSISKDFNAALSGTDGQRLLFESYLQGLISIDTYLQALADAELITIESTAKELEKIKSDDFTPQPKGNGVDNIDNRTKAAMNAS